MARPNPPGRQLDDGIAHDRFEGGKIATMPCRKYQL